jgi:uncharacterized protein (TIGR02271 family)
MTRTIRPQELIDSTVLDPQGTKIGKVGAVYLADDTRQPEWVTVKTGMFGHKESFVPLSGADVDNDGLHVNVAKDQVSDAPRIDADGHLSEDESVELYRYYGMPSPRSGNREDAAHSGRAKPQAGMATGTRDERGKRSQHARGDAHDRDDTMIRSEERMKVGTEQVETGRVRLRKYVVTEDQQMTVPVSHEEVRVEREPITDADRGTRAEIGEAEQDVVLHAEKPVVRKETVPVEKVRLGTEKVTDEETVTGKVRKEQIDVNDDTRRK